MVSLTLPRLALPSIPSLRLRRPGAVTGRRLGVAASTLHSHVKELYRHFGARSRAELMAHFLRRGWRGAATDLGHAGGPAPPPQ